LTISTLRFLSGWSMCTPTVDFHHLDSCHAWHTRKSCLKDSSELKLTHPLATIRKVILIKESLPLTEQLYYHSKIPLIHFKISDVLYLLDIKTPLEDIIQRGKTVQLYYKHRDFISKPHHFPFNSAK
ncbi:hypothetical protein M3699_28125, partial [Peribacillus simplex]|uniref:hypothetical protein n=1 Tax=Peribacillus simplex TaxID=1478 RepID=UPI00203B5466